MAEVKNSFLASKMNQDLDDRLIPNGEYREALNISVGKSENSDVGTLQNILGNEIVGDANSDGTECIGYFMDNVNNCIFQFLCREATEERPNPLYQITVDNFKDNTRTVLVEGTFLNFSKSLPISGITLVENLLFWTDYNNQPRKINIKSALASPAYSETPYYTREEQISVAKYAPVDPISLIKVVEATTDTECNDSDIVTVLDSTGIEEGMTLIASGEFAVFGSDFVIVEKIDGNNIYLSKKVTLGASQTITFLGSTMTNQSNDPLWPGDPAYLKSRYVRFSYRFKLDDGEYTLMAPFTQIAFIPNQKGYFINGNENDAYTSTVVNWFENNVNNIKLLIPFPDILSKVNQSYKIQALDILYKEADSLEVKVIETISYSQFASNTDTNIYTYNYQSRKPYKVLPTDQTTRVYDMVPVKALAQETSSNRIIYGNFLKNHTAPKSLNYQVSVTEKQDSAHNFIEYPNHTLKQNRTYQVGFILSDKYGRQSSVILSSLDTVATSQSNVVYGGSTVYSQYSSSDDPINARDWFGNALSVLVNSPITSTVSSTTGEPGLYAKQSSSTGFTLRDTTTITDSTYTFSVKAPSQVPTVGEFLRGEYTDYVEITTVDPNPDSVDPYETEFTIETKGRINNIYARNYDNDPNDTKYSYTINPLGWYSYKIVVRQQEQDYYNVYLPGLLNGYPKGQTYGSEVTYDGAGHATNHNGINTTNFPTSETGITTHTVLINDNINKVPRDLVEIGPDQKLYRSSVQLFGRVENMMIYSGESTSSPNNKQYYPSKKPDTAIAIATSTDLSFLPKTVDNELGSATYNFYQLETHPLIARIATVNSIGWTAEKNQGAEFFYASDYRNMLPYLSVYETKPETSLLDIFWETSTTGLISDLNTDVLTGFDGPVGLSDMSWELFVESAKYDNPSLKYITGVFNPVSNTNSDIDSTDMVMTVTNQGVDVTSSFGLETISESVNRYRIYIKNNFAFTNPPLSFQFTFTFIPENSVTPVIFTVVGRLGNVPPSITTPAIVEKDIYLNTPAASELPVYIFKANNGSSLSGSQKLGLRWSILDDFSTSGWQEYFSLTTNPTTRDGELRLINEYPSTGITYDLCVQVQDAVSDSGIPTYNSNYLYASQTDTCNAHIRLGNTTINCAGADRVWTTHNYEGEYYQDGTPIYQATNAYEWTNANKGAWCYPNFDENLGTIYGKLYNGYAILGIWNPLNPNDTKQFAPNKFRVPWFNEQCILGCITQGGSMKSTGILGSGGLWEAPNLGATNSTGFSALPAGYIDNLGAFYDRKYHAYFYWNAYNNGTNPPNSLNTFKLDYDTNNINLNYSGISLKHGYSVRFVDDASYDLNISSGLNGSCSIRFTNLQGQIQQTSLSFGEIGTITTAALCSVSGTCEW